MLTLANSKYDGRYLFSGTKTEEAPFSTSGRSAAEIGAAIADGGNTFDGEVTSSGTYEGLVDKSYKVEIVDGGALGAATYRVSSDGGGSWSAPPPSTVTETITLGDGIVLTFEDTGDTELAATDFFSIEAFAPEYYIGEPVGAGGNTFDGTVASSGTYTGSVNGTYAVKIVAGEALVDATYRVSVDGGKTWLGEDPENPGELGDTGDLPFDDLSGTITLGDGIDLTFTDNGAADLATDDIFYVQALAAGYYNGNGEEMSVNIGEGTPFAYSVSGEAAFTVTEEGSVDVFGVLNELKTALETNDVDGIAACLDGLTAAADQISKNISKCGARMNRLEIAKKNMADMDMDLVGLISNVEDADVSEIITKFAMKEIALKASYATASKIGNLTILDFLR